MTMWGSFGRRRGRPSAPKRLSKQSRPNLLQFLEESPHARYPALNRYKVGRDNRYKVSYGALRVRSRRWF